MIKCKAMIVYIIFNGTYSDRTTVAVYGKETDAKNYIENNLKREKDGSQSKYDEYDIEEWEVNTTCALIKDRSIWRVDMARNGTTLWVGREPNNIEVSQGFYRHWDCDTVQFLDDLKLICYVEAKDEKHAVKIVNEKRAMLIANNEWEEIQKGVS